MTLCSNCLDKVPLDELYPLMAAELQMVADNPITLELTTLEVACALGYMQLGLRHPAAKVMLGAPHARKVVDHIQAQFTELGLVVLAELANRGDDPQHDLPVPGFEHARAFRRN